MSKHNLSVWPQYVCEVEPRQEDALNSVTELLKTLEPPTALFCMNDSLAVGAIKAALRLGKKVPDDIAIVGYDGSSICTVIEPELTSVSIDTDAMGRIAARKIIGIINGEKYDAKAIQLPTKLVTRQST